ncbi:ABC transporter substrate-binding protein [Kroppenstedtia pulmonis]|uniref:ABC transporter substrate-binding protein n=1 Tax=Kroppenstedtia pulmonis TaxID=1380685 RepID=UPI001FE679DE|nr:iron-siderophore ABC transporter substrate-binding protein [Kroppenstedtia pulmonis]
MFDSKSKYLVIFLSFLLVIIIAGCGTDTEEKAESEQIREVKHAMGVTKIPGTPKRVVVLTNEGTEAVLSLGIKPVGAVHSWSGNPWYKHIAKEMKGVAVVGDESQPNIEKIASLKPDLIIGTQFRQEKAYKQLSQIAPTVFSETLRGDWQENFSLYAEALNKKEEGKKVLADYEQKIADGKKKLGSKLKEEVSIVRFMPGKVRIYHKDSFSGVLLEDLGLARPKPQDKDGLASDITKERIPDMDGDILFYFVWEGKENSSEVAEVAQDWMKDPLWKKLNVVQKDRVYQVSDDTWNTSGGVISAKMMLEELLQYFSK